MMRSGRPYRLMRTVILVAVLLTSLTSLGSEALTSSKYKGVSLPTVTGPVTGGVRTGRPFASAIFDLAPNGYIEREYFIEGTANASSAGGFDVPSPTSASGPTAAYKTRMLTLLPPRNRFNGWVYVEWSNVTLQYDVNYDWFRLHDYLMRQGYAIVSVSAQKQGVDGSHTSLRFWDDARYGSLVHPGDAYANNIFSQTLAAIRAGRKLPADPMRGLKVKRVVVGGSSQSCGTILGYLRNSTKEAAALVDGALPTICGGAAPDGSKTVIPQGAPKTLQLNSESEGGTVPGPDSKNYRIWEIAGPSHVENYAIIQVVTTSARDFGSVGGSSIPAVGRDANAERQYGQHGSRACSNLFPMHYAMKAGAERLREWILKGRAPASVRYRRSNGTSYDRDANSNMLGGVRLPPIAVPVAQYFGDSCPYDGIHAPLTGSTYKFDASKLASLYPTHQAYVNRMRSATRYAFAKGWMLQPEADEMMALAEVAPIPS